MNMVLIFCIFVASVILSKEFYSMSNGEVGKVGSIVMFCLGITYTVALMCLNISGGMSSLNPAFTRTSILVLSILSWVVVRQ